MTVLATSAHRAAAGQHDRGSLRTFTDAEQDEIRTHQLRSSRWTFLVSGLEDPNIVAIVEELTAGGADKLGQAAAALSA